VGGGEEKERRVVEGVKGSVEPSSDSGEVLAKAF